MGAQFPIVDAIITPALTLFVEDIMKKWCVPGLTVAVVRLKSETEVQAWGRRSEAGDPATPDTLFALGSCSKAFLAAAIGILIDDHASGQVSSHALMRLNWDTKLHDALGDQFNLMDEWADAKSDLRDVLSHMTGVAAHELALTANDTPEDVVRRMRYLRPAHEFRKKFLYTNHMYILAAHLISRYSGMPYSEFVRTRIFEPLGMDSTTFDTHSDIEKNMSQCWSDGGRRVPILLEGKAIELLAAPGGVMSSAADLAKWIKMLLARGVDPTTNRTILSRAAFDVISTPLHLSTLQLRPDLGVAGYGLGWFKSMYEGRPVLTHPGVIRGFGSLITLFPNEGLGMAVLMNTDEVYNVPATITYHIVNKLFGSEGAKNLRIGKILPAPIPQSTPAPLPLAAYAGTYTNAGYGSITLCAPSPPSLPPSSSSSPPPYISSPFTDTDSPHCTSHHCADVLAEFKAMEEQGGAPLPPALYAVWPRVCATHVRLAHTFPVCTDVSNLSSTCTPRHIFVLTTETHFPAGFGADTTPFLLRRSRDRYEVEFVVDKERSGKSVNVLGFGIMSDVGLQMTPSEQTGRSVRDRALVWFEKV